MRCRQREQTGGLDDYLSVSIATFRSLFTHAEHNGDNFLIEKPRVETTLESYLDAFLMSLRRTLQSRIRTRCGVRGQSDEQATLRRDSVFRGVNNNLHV